jgi:hypothetical protein
MLSLDVRIDRAQRLLRMMEEDAPLLAVRIAELTPEHQQSAKNHAARLIAHTRGELEQLSQERIVWMTRDSTPQPAD